MTVQRLSIRGLAAVRIVVAAALVARLPAAADEVVVMTSGAFTAPFEVAAPWFERRTGHDVVAVFGASTGGAPDSIPVRLARGERADVVIASAQAVDALIAAGAVERGSRRDLVLSRIGVAVRAGARKPDISSVDALVRAVREARSIAYSASVSGTYLATELFPRLGLAAEIAAKGRRIESERVGAVVARGDAELGFQQISELVTIDGLEYVGPLPDEVQRVSTFSAGIAAGAKSPPAARELVAFLASIALAPVVERYGLDQVEYTASDWRPLFNGRDLAAWTPKIRRHALGDNFAGTFRVRDGMIEVGYEGYDTFAEQFGHLFYREPFSRYRLRVEYRFVGAQAPDAPAWAARNSGVMVHSQAPETMLRDQDFPISIEVQFLGGLGDGKARPTGNVCSPGTRLVYAGAPDTSHCIQSTAPTIDGDAWVTADVVVLGDERIVHYIDGVPVIEYGGIAYGGGNVNGHDPKDKPDGSPLERGYISLQSESHPIQFRRVELLDLTGCTEACR
ncbi:MAG TPA: substrate-binding domain-containing protein [Gammaproteobacteria bacterium]|nr:substrate-binding domain-containing protein [Gammaproteobacteria bacterium]